MNRNQRKRPRRRKRPPSDCYTTASYGRALARACEKAGVPRFGPNRLRHSSGTFLRREYGLETAKAVLGHASCNITGVYAEIDQSLAMKAMAEVG
jgi:integrase